MNYNLPDFTFHYVSINTITANPCPRVTFFFTFHYVSINTFSVLIMKDELRSLHSTMFLLIR